MLGRTGSFVPRVTLALMDLALESTQAIVRSPITWPVSGLTLFSFFLIWHSFLPHMTRSLGNPRSSIGKSAEEETRDGPCPIQICQYKAQPYAMAGWSSAARRFIPHYFTSSPHAYERLETMEPNHPPSDPSSSKTNVEAIEAANVEQAAAPEHVVPTGCRDKAAELLDSVPPG